MTEEPHRKDFITLTRYVSRIQKILKGVFLVVALIGVAAIGASIWSLHELNQMTPEEIAAARSVPQPSRSERLREACETEVGYRGIEAVEQCEIRIMAEMMVEQQQAAAEVEAQEIGRARDRLR